MEHFNKKLSDIYNQADSLGSDLPEELSWHNMEDGILERMDDQPQSPFKRLRKYLAFLLLLIMVSVSSMLVYQSISNKSTSKKETQESEDTVKKENAVMAQNIAETQKEERTDKSSVKTISDVAVETESRNSVVNSKKSERKQKNKTTSKQSENKNSKPQINRTEENKAKGNLVTDKRVEAKSQNVRTKYEQIPSHSKIRNQGSNIFESKPKDILTFRYNTPNRVDEVSEKSSNLKGIKVCDY